MEFSYRFLDAAPGCRAAICGVWELTLPRAAPSEPIAPDGCPELVIHLTGQVTRTLAGQDQASARGVIAQPVTGVLTVRAAGPVHIRALRFQPTGLYRLGLNPEALRDLAVSPREGLGDLGADLAHALEAAPQLDAALMTVEALVAQRLARQGANPVFDARALAAIANTPSEAGLEALTGWTGRHVRRLLLRATGHSPSELRRLAQFHAARALVVTTSLGYAAIAAQSGFVDQAHMIRRFKALGGATPAALRRDAGGFGALYA
jgi:AraC-like DNA-binding protein